MCYRKGRLGRIGLSTLADLLAGPPYTLMKRTQAGHVVIDYEGLSWPWNTCVNSPSGAARQRASTLLTGKAGSFWFTPASSGEGFRGLVGCTCFGPRSACSVVLCLYSAGSVPPHVVCLTFRCCIILSKGEIDHFGDLTCSLHEGYAFSECPRVTRGVGRGSL